MRTEPVVGGNVPNKKKKKKKKKNSYYICCNECRCCDSRSDGITPPDGSVPTLPITGGAEKYPQFVDKCPRKEKKVMQKQGRKTDMSFELGGSVGVDGVQYLSVLLTPNKELNVLN